MLHSCNEMSRSPAPSLKASASMRRSPVYCALGLSATLAAVGGTGEPSLVCSRNHIDEFGPMSSSKRVASAYPGTLFVYAQGIDPPTLSTFDLVAADGTVQGLQRAQEFAELAAGDYVVRARSQIDEGTATVFKLLSEDRYQVVTVAAGSRTVVDLHYERVPLREAEREAENTWRLLLIKVGVEMGRELNSVGIEKYDCRAITARILKEIHADISEGELPYLEVIDWRPEVDPCKLFVRVLTAQVRNLLVPQHPLFTSVVPKGAVRLGDP